MIPQTYPNNLNPFSDMSQCVITYLSSVSGMTAWTDYIPVRTVSATGNIEGRTEATGYQAVYVLTVLTNKTAWIDYIPVYEDGTKTVAWSTDANGYIPIGISEAGAEQILSEADFQADLTHSLVLDAGTGSPTFTRATTATFQDFEGVLRYVPAGCARFTGARMVRNLLSYTEQIENAYWTKIADPGSVTPTVTDNYGEAPDGTMTASRIQCDYGSGVYSSVRGTPSASTTPLNSCWIKSNTGESQTVCVALNTVETFVATTEWQQYATTNVYAGGEFDIVASRRGISDKVIDVLVWHPQQEDITGRTDQTTPSEYVSVGVGVQSISVTNSTFDSDTAWTKESGWTISGGTANFNASASAAIYQNVSLISGATYEVTYTVSNYVSGTFTARAGAGSFGTNRTANGTYTEVLTAGAGGNLLIYGAVSAAATQGSIDNIIVKKCDHGAGVDGIKCFDSDLTGAPIPSSTLKGYLAEPAATNLFPDSKVFSSWTNDGTSITDNAIAAPDGTTTADKMLETAANYSHGRYKSISIASGTIYTVSWYAKKGERDYVAINHNGTGWYAASYWNINTGIVQSSGAGHTNSIESVGDGWFRCTHTFTAGITAAVAFDILNSDDGARVSYAGDITKGIYVWGAQFELGSAATSYIPTTTVAVARNADVLTYTGGDIANIKTLAATFSRGVGVSNAGAIVELNDGTSNNIAIMYLGDATTTRWQGNVGGSTGTWNPPAKTYTAGSVSKVSQSWATNDFKGDLNGSACTPDTSTGVPTLTQMNVGHELGTFVFNGHVGGIYGWTRNLSQSELGAVDR